MSAPLPLTIVVAALEPNRDYTPQQLAEAIAERLQVNSTQSFALFSAGTTEPAFDTGPWAKNGNEWYYFSTTTGSYVPFVVGQSSLRFWVGADEPDPATYLFWIQLNGAGEPIALKTYVNGAWEGVYYAKTELYTITEIDAFFEPTVAGKKQIDWANVINKPGSLVYPAMAQPSVAQNITTNNNQVKVNLATATIDINAVFDATNSRYVAPVNGIYEVSATIQVNNVSAQTTTFTGNLDVLKNGGAGVAGALEPINSGGGATIWAPQIAGTLVPLNAGDYLELWARMADGPGTNQVQIDPNTKVNFKLVLAL